MDAFRAPDRAAEAGVQWQRIMFDWSAIQRHGPDEWSFGSASAEIASRERIAGRPIVGQFISTPTWASGTSDPKSPPLGLDLRVDEPGNVWAAWIRAVVGRFEGLIDTWVMWNEPDVWSDDNRARQWTGTIEQYYQLLKVGYLAAKSANPNARVMLAGMTYCWDAAYGREQYFERLVRLISADTSARANGWYFDAAVLQQSARALRRNAHLPRPDAHARRRQARVGERDERGAVGRSLRAVEPRTLPRHPGRAGQLPGAARSRAQARSLRWARARS